MPGKVAGFFVEGGGGLAGNPPGCAGAGWGAVICCGFGRRDSGAEVVSARYPAVPPPETLYPGNSY